MIGADERRAKFLAAAAERLRDREAEKVAKKSQATELVELALTEFQLVRGFDEQLYAIPHTGNRVALSLDSGRSTLRSELAAIYYERNQKVPGRNSLGEAVEVLRGMAAAGPAQPVHLRHSGTGALHARYVDLGGDQGAVMILPNIWSPVPDCAVFWRRTDLSATFPDLPAELAEGEDDEDDPLEQLHGVMNVTDADFPVLVGWLIAVLYGDIPVPIVQLTGEQGSGKTTAARRIVDMVDPSTVPVRAAPRDLEAWIVAAAGSRVVCLDNLSTVQDWLSDALCRAVTGEGLVRRRLYTDSEISTIWFRRAVILTTIDAGVMRGDLAERLLPIELERITEGRRRTESEIEARWAEIRGPVFSALLSLACEVLAVMTDPDFEPGDLPRLADFGTVLAALDQITGWNSLAHYRHSVANSMRDVAAGDPLAEAIVRIGRSEKRWEGNVKSLLTLVDAWKPDDTKFWPKTPRGLSSALSRLAPAVRSMGVDVTWGERTAEGRRVILTSLEGQ